MSAIRCKESKRHPIAARSGEATGFGPAVSTSFIQVKRKVGAVLRGAVSVRYVKK